MVVGVLQIMFWNLKKNANENLIADIIEEQNIDIALFAEYLSTDFSTVTDILGDEYRYCVGYGGCEKISLLARTSIQVSVRREQNRYVIYTCEVDGDKFIIAGAHLPANPHSGPEERKIVIRDLIQDVNMLEKEMKHYNTIIIGDFNASPFDDELVAKDAFNAVLYKGVIMQQESVTVEGKKYRRFYNPMLDYISEKNEIYGSLYYSSGATTLYWYCYDQIIVRKPLVERIRDISYCRKIKSRRLIKDVAPDKSISDHLPLLVEIERGVCNA